MRLLRSILAMSVVSRNFFETQETGSVLKKLEPYEKDEDKEKIIKVWRMWRSLRNVSVCPILGIGGLGLKICVYVSKDFDLKRMIKQW